jgi:hypothetical protein
LLRLPASLHAADILYCVSLALIMSQKIVKKAGTPVTDIEESVAQVQYQLDLISLSWMPQSRLMW